MLHCPENLSAYVSLLPTNFQPSKFGGLSPAVAYKNLSLRRQRHPQALSDDDQQDKESHPLPTYKWRLVISYDGTRYSGWQYQQSIPTVQCKVEEALTRITKLERKHLCLVGAGRTDAGVHAWGQVAHFITPFKYECLEGFHRALNGGLPPDIRIREISSVLPEFHARFSVKSKTYNYKIYNDAVMDPIQRHYVYHSSYKLNPSAMKDAAKYFVGKHDFSAFANASHNDGIPNPVKNILRFHVNEMGPLLQIEVEGSGFLYKQVRNMVAIMLQVGREAVPAEIVPMILESRDRKELAKYTLAVPPHGLCLYGVKYNEDHFNIPLATSFGMHHTISKCKLPFY
ncbi:hypothetical protein ABFS82_01G108600 [Erythranthe guttata]|nr:PREDICTED: tRNA pseudouridine synthase-like 1 [Erythranthe guttata]|eukprot:XP_012837559.1 PREDICTED: tRNA pseudouridine synthase-like 1 [Erythranthe guttata]